MATGTFCNIFLGNHKSSTVSRVGGKCACNIFTASCVRFMLLLYGSLSVILSSLLSPNNWSATQILHAYNFYIHRTVVLIRFKRNSQQTKPLFKVFLFLSLSLLVPPSRSFTLKFLKEFLMRNNFVVHASMTRVIFNSVIGSLAFYTFFLLPLLLLLDEYAFHRYVCVWFVAKTNLCNQQNVDEEKKKTVLWRRRMTSSDHCTPSGIGCLVRIYEALFLREIVYRRTWNATARNEKKKRAEKEEREKWKKKSTV